jgi:phage-related protein
MRLLGRALYVTAIGRWVVVVRAYVKKTQKTPRSEIELALRRAEEIK